MARKSTARKYTGDFAYCWRSGVIEFGKSIPDGALPLGRGKGRDWEDGVRAMGRRAYDGESYLVPGVPEAENDNAAMAAVQRFVVWLEKRERFLAAA